MEKLLFYTEEERDLMMDFYKKDLQIVESEIEVLTERKNRIITRLNEMLEFEERTNDFKSRDYDIELSLAKKAEFFLRRNNRVLTTRQIANHIYAMERALGNSNVASIPDLVSNLGATLKQKVDKADMFARFHISAEWKYGLREWLVEENMLPTDYQ